MKLLLCLILFSVLNVSGSIFSQSATFDLAVNGKTVKEVFRVIESQSHYHLMYNDDFAGLNRVVSSNTKDYDNDEVLNELIAGANLTYRELENELIVITPNHVYQQRVITGTVTDVNGEPLPGVAVRVSGKTIGTVTDIDGFYSLEVPDDAEYLTYTYVGMIGQEVLIGEQLEIKIVMVADVVGLDEIVVIGYGTQTRANVIGSVTTITSDEIASSPVSSVSQALAGRLPGAVFMQTSGKPGDDAATIRIRGNATLGNNSPLVVVDGIPDRDINSLHPEDIESITVLKDASAAIYGARAANGVILVTTKRGDRDTAPIFNYSFREGFLSPVKLQEMADAPTYATMIREMQSYQGVDEVNMAFSLDDITKYESGEYPWTHPNTDWFSEALRDFSSTRHHNFSVSGGTSNINYYGSLGTQFDDGIYHNSATKYNRYNMKAAIDANINEYLTVGIDVSGSRENLMDPSVSSGNIWNFMTRSRPTDHAFYPNGLPGPDIEYGYQPVVASTLETGFDDDKRYRLNNVFSAALQIPGVEGLSLSGYYAYDKFFRSRKRFDKPFELFELDESSYLNAGNTGVEDGSDFIVGAQKGYPEPRLRDNYYENDRNTANIRLGYTNSFNDVHNLDVFIAYEQFKYDYHMIEAFRRFFLTDQLPYLFAGGDAQKDNTGAVSLDAGRNYFGRFSYNYRETYLFQFSLRRDGSLRFSEEAGRWGNFPSVLVGWRPSEQDWWQNSLGFIDYFKLKASYGQMGNDRVPAFQYLAAYGFGNGGVYGDGRAYETGLYQLATPNPIITWEVSNVYNFGWESMFINNKMAFDADFFYERRSNILVQRSESTPYFTGISLPDENFGIVDNKGFELILSYNERQSGLRYGFSGNFAFARNTIIEYDEPERSVPWQQRTGNPMGSFLIYESDGIFRDWDHVNSLPHVPGARPGDIIIKDYDGDGVITPDDRVLYPFTTTPEITFGFSFNVGYKNWNLRGLIQGQGRATRHMFTDDRQGTAGNYFAYQADGRWTEDNPDATRPRSFERLEPYWRTATWRTDYNYANTSFARLKNLELSYTIPPSLMNSLGIKNARVYVSGNNLLLLYSGNPIMDPETSGMGGYPIMRVIALGAEISF